MSFIKLRRAVGVAALAALTGTGALALAAPASAVGPQTRYVAANGSDGTDPVNDCTVPATPCKTIQHAVDEANAGDTVSVGAGTYAESVRIRTPLTLVGHGATGTNKTVVDGSSGPSISLDGVDVSAPVVVTIRGMAIDGNGADDGIFVQSATLHLIDSRASGNTNSGVDLAGVSAATIENSTLSNNGVDGVTADNFSNNLRSAAAAVTTESVTISGSDLSDNANEGVNAVDATVAIDHSTINRNADGGVVLNNGTTATLDTTTLDSNIGAGVVVDGPGNVVSVHASTISSTKPFTGERAAFQPYGGGVLVFEGTAHIQASTIHRNTGQGVLALGADVTIDNSTITGTKQPAGENGTSGGGPLKLPYGNVAVDSQLQPAARRAVTPLYPVGTPSQVGTVRRAAAPVTPKTTVTGSIVANSSTQLECNGAVTDGGYNLSSDAANSCKFTAAAHSITKTAARIGALADNGGPTLTEKPLKGSPAIDGVASGKAGCVSGATDQRGASRPQPTGGACDIGAVELAAKAIVIHPDSLPHGTVGTAYNAILSATGGAYPTYVWSLAPGSSLPDGLSLSSTGHITGTPTKAGTYSVTVSVNDPVLKRYTIVIDAATGTNGNGSEPISATGAPVESMTAVAAGSIFAGFLLMVGAGLIGRRPGRHRVRS